MAIDVSLALDTARKAVAAAAAAAMKHFRQGLTVELKADRSPVTVADRESEAAILAVLRAAFPRASILTEESGAFPGTAELRWIVDPLDGTRGFSRGGTFWGPLVALEHQGEVIAGAMAMPALGTQYWAARGMGAYRDGTKLRVSSVAAWNDSILSMGELHKLLADPWAKGVCELATASATARCYGDLAGCAMVLDGRAEAWIEAGVQPWDLGPYPILIAEAGGRYTDFRGGCDLAEGTAIGSNGLVHDRVLGALRERLT